MRTLLITLAGLSVAAPLFAHDVEREVGDKNCRVILHDDGTPESVRWSGGCNAGYAEGAGVLDWKYRKDAAASKYEGALHKGRMHGDGYLKRASGTQYEGNFSEGKPHGTGTRVDNEGRYDGNWVAGEPDGFGKMVYVLGGSYEGQWKAGKLHGKGTATYVGGRTVTAEFVEGRRVEQAAAAPKSDKEFRISRLDHQLSAIALSTGIPFSRSYDEMSAAEKQRVRDMYVLDDDDEPPYPANGTRRIYQRIGDAQQARLIEGELHMHVHIDSQGNPTQITTYASPDPVMTQWASRVLATEKFKPGVC
ncbi:MAG: MORN repeat-containing protein [Telluria sp.]